MKRRKQIFLLLLIFVLCFCGFFATGCLNDNDNDKQNTDISQNDPERDEDNKDDEDYKNPEVHDNDNDKTQTINIVGFGDSISAGYAVEGSNMYDAYISYEDGDSLINSMCYTNLIANQLKQRRESVNVKSYAKSGDKTADLISKLNDKTNYPNLENDVKSADIITLCVGANNVLGVMLDNLENYFTGTVTLNEIEAQLQQGLNNFKNEYTNTIIPYLTQGSAKVYVMTVYNPYLYFSFDDMTFTSSFADITESLKNYFGGEFNKLKAKAIQYLEQINQYIKSQSYQNVIVVDIDANFKSIAKSEYSNYINADSSKVVVNIDEVFDIQTFTLRDTSVLQNNQYFDPHPTSFGQQYIANLFLEIINNVNN